MNLYDNDDDVEQGGKLFRDGKSNICKHVKKKNIDMSHNWKRVWKHLKFIHFFGFNSGLNFNY